jgi:hypothetical protein
VDVKVHKLTRQEARENGGGGGGHLALFMTILFEKPAWAPLGVNLISFRAVPQ